MQGIFNPRTLEAEAGRSLDVQDRHEFQDSQGFIEKPSLNTPPQKKRERERGEHTLASYPLTATPPGTLWYAHVPFPPNTYHLGNKCNENNLVQCSLFWF